MMGSELLYGFLTDLHNSMDWSQEFHNRVVPQVGPIPGKMLSPKLTDYRKRLNKARLIPGGSLLACRIVAGCLFHLSDAKNLVATFGTNTLDGSAAIFEGYLFWVLHLHHLSVLNTISLHNSLLF